MIHSSSVIITHFNISELRKNISFLLFAEGTENTNIFTLNIVFCLYSLLLRFGYETGFSLKEWRHDFDITLVSIGHKVFYERM